MRSMVHPGIATAQSEQPHIKVLRAVASLELIKGLIVLAAGFGVLLLTHKDPGDIADWFLSVLHISPDHHFAQVFLDWADTLTDTKLWVVAGVAAVYSMLRFIEAYGLWKARAWAEWIALVSGTLYLPFEIYKVMQSRNLFHVSVLTVNLAVVVYIAYVLLDARASKARLQT